MTAARRAAWWLAPPLVCLLLHWYGFLSWFRADDFAWLGVGLNRHGLHDYLAAIFTPMAQGTIRPWSDRLFFMAGFRLFGLNPLPFRIVVFATQFVNMVYPLALFQTTIRYGIYGISLVIKLIAFILRMAIYQKQALHDEE